MITSLVCIGIRRTLEPDMIFEKIGTYLENILTKYQTNKAIIFILKPVYSCIYCMSSLYSIILYSIFMNYSLNSFYELPIMILAVCGLNGVIYNLNYLETDV